MARVRARRDEESIWTSFDREYADAPAPRGVAPGWDVDAQATMFANRLKKNRKKLAAEFEKRRIGAYRLYDRDIPEIRCIVDWYEGHLVIAEYVRDQTSHYPDWLGRMADAAASALSVAPADVHVKVREARAGVRYARGGEATTQLWVREGEVVFEVDLDAHLDTGLFLDHRITRRLVAADAVGRSLLNLYAYTGSFSVVAAHAGAHETVSVDRSGNYLAWAERNFAENRLLGPSHHFVRMDALSFLDRSRARGDRFDVIVLDPPSFSTGGDDPPLDIDRDHPELLHAALEVLARDGVLWFSTNHQRFQPRFQGLPCRTIVERTADTIPVDVRNTQAHRVFRITR